MKDDGTFNVVLHAARRGLKHANLLHQHAELSSQMQQNAPLTRAQASDRKGPRNEAVSNCNITRIRMQTRRCKTVPCAR